MNKTINEGTHRTHFCELSKSIVQQVYMGGEWLCLHDIAKTVEVLQHKIEWWLDDEHIVNLDDSDLEHIAYMITQGYSEGELNHGEDEIEGYWKINNNL